MAFRIILEVDNGVEKKQLIRESDLTKMSGHSRTDLEMEFEDMLDYIFRPKEKDGTRTEE